MEFLTADYVIFAVAGIFAILGMIGGFSSAAAFSAGTVAGVVSAYVGWGFLADRFSETWSHALASAAIALVAFALARIIVRKVVHNLLAQPADAIFGSLTGAISGFAIAASVATLLVIMNIVPINSTVVDYVRSAYVGVSS